MGRPVAAHTLATVGEARMRGDGSLPTACGTAGCDLVEIPRYKCALRFLTWGEEKLTEWPRHAAIDAVLPV